MPDSYIALPLPRTDSGTPLEAAIVRTYPVVPYACGYLTEDQIGQLLWAGHTSCGIHRSRRTNGVTWLVLYVCRPDGAWRYHAQEHCLTRHLSSDVRTELADAARNRWFVAQAPCILVLSAVPRCAAARFGQRWLHWLPIEVGRVVERIRLQAIALGLASVPIVEFDCPGVERVLTLSRQEEPLYLLPVGWPAREDRS